MTLTRHQLTDLLIRYDLSPSRALGQNFVADPNTVRRIARLSGVGPGDAVVEIGAGVGSLTLALAETGARVVAVEIDRYLTPVLRSLVEPVGVEVVEGDALRLPWSSLLAERAPGPWVLVANLPYNISTPLVIRLLEEVPAVGRMLVMVQREVAERLAAVVGADAYGAPSVKVAYWAVASVVGRVPPTVFVPRPRVESALVAIERRDEPAVPRETVSYERLFTVVRAGFAQRRKMLRRALEGIVSPEAFAEAESPPSARAEELDVEAWGRLAAAAGAGGQP